MTKKGDGMLTDDGLVEETPNRIGGVQRIYRWGNWGLSLINASMAHSYEYAWEAAVLDYRNDPRGPISYETPLTSDVEVFATEEEANEFIQKAKEYFTSNQSQEPKESK